MKYENASIQDSQNKKRYVTKKFQMPAAGLEPARGCPQQILSLPRLPFRHAGMRFFNVTYLIIGTDELQVFFEKY